jgi:hypothetical protein
MIIYNYKFLAISLEELLDKAMRKATIHQGLTLKIVILQYFHNKKPHLLMIRSVYQ